MQLHPTSQHLPTTSNNSKRNNKKGLTLKVTPFLFITLNCRLLQQARTTKFTSVAERNKDLERSEKC